MHVYKSNIIKRERQHQRRHIFFDQQNGNISTDILKNQIFYFQFFSPRYKLFSYNFINNTATTKSHIRPFRILYGYRFLGDILWRQIPLQASIEVSIKRKEKRKANIISNNINKYSLTESDTINDYDYIDYHALYF